jgi:hypothetical protein
MVAGAQSDQRAQSGAQSKTLCAPDFSLIFLYFFFFRDQREKKSKKSVKKL